MEYGISLQYMFAWIFSKYLCERIVPHKYYMAKLKEHFSN
jgi:hypothetical protein